jgi:hypothetical protein
MDFLQVTTGDIEALAGSLSSLVGELQQAGDVRGVSGGAAENGQLSAAIEGFTTRWTESLQELEITLLSLTERLIGASTSYEHVEQTVVGGFSR